MFLFVIISAEFPILAAEFGFIAADLTSKLLQNSRFFSRGIPECLHSAYGRHFRLEKLHIAFTFAGPEC